MVGFYHGFDQNILLQEALKKINPSIILTFLAVCVEDLDLVRLVFVMLQDHTCFGDYTMP